MVEATSCGGVVIYRNKILLLYKNYKNKYDGWVLPKGTVEEGETHEETALREVLEESGAKAEIVQFVGTSNYTFHVPNDIVPSYPESSSQTGNGGECDGSPWTAGQGLPDLGGRTYAVCQRCGDGSGAG